MDGTVKPDPCFPEEPQGTRPMTKPVANAPKESPPPIFEHMWVYEMVDDLSSEAAVWRSCIEKIEAAVGGTADETTQRVVRAAIQHARVKIEKIKFERAESRRRARHNQCGQM
jgi:hypothetical protein